MARIIPRHAASFSGTDLENNMAGCLDLFEPAKCGDSTVPFVTPKFSWLEEPTRPKPAVIKDLHLLPRVSSQRLVAPVVEIHSIQIRHSNPRVLNEGDKCEIYGRIRVVDELGDESFIFDRNRDSPKFVDCHGSLTLSSPYFLRSAKVGVRMTLWDKAHDDVVIASGARLLGQSLDGSVTDHVDVDGNHGWFSRLHYAFYPYAVTATVQVLYFSKDHDFDIFEDVQKPELDERLYDSEGGFMREGFDKYDNIDYDELVCGTSVAGIFGSVAASNDLDESNTSILFRVPPEKSVQVTSGSFIKLSRSVVVVPANSSLKVDVDLFDGSTQLPIARSTVEFIPRHSSTYKDIVGDSGRIRVRVEWSDAYQQLDGAQLDGARELLKLLFFGIPPAMSNNYHPMIEVFSILVFGFEPLRIYGKIIADGNYCIYDRDENCPQQCSGVGTSVELDCHRSFSLLDEFGMWVELKDVEKRYEIIYGHMIWRPFQVKPRSKWLDRPLCSLIRGVGAFAAVHYEIFSDALAAKVDVKLFSLGDSLRVSGKLIARHDNSSSYDKEYYQSVLFHKGANDLLVLKNGSSLPLSKSVVAFPRNSSLIFEVDIGASHVDYDTPIKVNTIFPLHCIQGGEVTRKIQGITFVIVVSVKCEVGFCC